MVAALKEKGWGKATQESTVGDIYSHRIFAFTHNRGLFPVKQSASRWVDHNTKITTKISRSNSVF